MREKNASQWANGGKTKSTRSKRRVEAIPIVQTGIAMILARKPISEKRLKYQIKMGNIPMVTAREARNVCAIERIKFPQIFFGTKEWLGIIKDSISSSEVVDLTIFSSFGSKKIREAIAIKES